MYVGADNTILFDQKQGNLQPLNSTLGAAEGCEEFANLHRQQLMLSPGQHQNQQLLR
jgi:hypothetical protein